MPNKLSCPKNRPDDVFSENSTLNGRQFLMHYLSTVTSVDGWMDGWLYGKEQKIKYRMNGGMNGQINVTTHTRTEAYSSSITTADQMNAFSLFDVGDASCGQNDKQ